MENDVWRKTIKTFEFDYNWNIDDWCRFGEKQDIILHCNALTDKIYDREMFMKGVDYSYYYEQEDEITGVDGE
ncbi:MAG: hypothetical protein PHV32_17390 [Eubacteriales bacterium]|nr:hypothetical protein [Eubacteriales bacterium]